MVESFNFVDRKKAFECNQLFSFVFIMGLGVVISSFFISLVQGVTPCFLCRLERVPYFLMVGSALVGIFINSKKKIVRLIQLWALLSVFLAGLHIGVQQKAFPDLCIKRQKSVVSVGEYQAFLKNQVGCSKSSWNFLGVPMTFWNGALSCALLFGVELFLRKKEI